MPACALGPTTTAPAPSAKMKAVERSVGSMKVLSFSTPITRAWPALPARTASEASARAWQNPEQPAETSNAAACDPRRSAICGAEAGVCWVWVEVATITSPMSAAETPAAARASSAARVPMSSTVSSSRAKRRDRMPDRDWIHSSLESRTSQISSLVTTRSGR